MELVRIINCLLPVNPEAGKMPEHDSDLGYLLKLAGLAYAGIAALVGFSSEADTKHIVIAGATAAALYLAGAAKDYLTLRKADRIAAYLEQHEKDLRELPPMEYNQKYRDASIS
jgi:hypothetical protein